MKSNLERLLWAKVEKGRGKILTNKRALAFIVTFCEKHSLLKHLVDDLGNKRPFKVPIKFHLHRYVALKSNCMKLFGMKPDADLI